ncbi:putative metal-binding motif-containing protein [Candidatus Woesearchaeota archaeon]|nr:putative metal-binding motif-containing protein [Candidatus Woesearchaeota archaeon]
MKWSLGIAGIILAGILLSLAIADPPTAPQAPGTPPFASCTPSDEVCDGKDNDCDGLIDAEDPDYTALLADKQDGVCEGAVKYCIAGTAIEPDYAAYNNSYEEKEESCSDGKDNDCDGYVDDDDYNCRSSGGGGGGGTYTPPNQEDEEDGGEEEQAAQVTDAALNWTYTYTIASTSINESGFSIKQLFGSLPQNEVPENSSLHKDGSLTGAPEGYDVYQSFSFSDAARSTVFEELFVVFGVPEAWLAEHGAEQGNVTVLYRSHDEWVAGTTSYLEDEGLYQAVLVNAPLDQLLVAAARPAANGSLEKEQEPAGNTTGIEEEGPSPNVRIPPALIALIIVVVLGGSVGGFFVARNRKHGTARLGEGVVPLETGPSALGGGHPSPVVTGQSSSLAKPVIPATAADNPRLREFIKRKRAEGVPDKAIRERLLAVGWQPSVVDQHLSKDSSLVQQP